MMSVKVSHRTSANKLLGKENNTEGNTMAEHLITHNSRS